MILKSKDTYSLGLWESAFKLGDGIVLSLPSWEKRGAILKDVVRYTEYKYKDDPLDKISHFKIVIGIVNVSL